MFKATRVAAATLRRKGATDNVKTLNNAIGVRRTSPDIETNLTADPSDLDATTKIRATVEIEDKPNTQRKVTGLTDLTMSLSNAGLRQLQSKPLYHNHRPPP
jgi:hypothetical protein